MANSLAKAVSKPEPIPKRTRYTKRLAALKEERNSWVEHWRELTEHFQPRRSRLNAGTERNRGTKRNDKILNAVPLRAVRILASGMMAGITSPARPWFRLSTTLPGLSENENVRGWLHAVEEEIREAIAKSNLYNALPVIYQDLGVISTSVCILDEDDETVVRAYVLPVGQYYLAANAKLKVDTLYRELSMTVQQLVEKFGIEKCSPSVQESHRQGNLDQWIDITHVITPNSERDAKRADYRGKPWTSCWFEKSRSDDSNAFLHEGGYDELPFVAPRWYVTGEDVYGSGPGMDALPEAKALNFLEKRLAQQVDKVTNPPMKAPVSMRSTRISLLPGDVTYGDSTSGTLEPALRMDPSAIQQTERQIARKEESINSTFMVDLWLMLADSDRRQITAREVDERHEEKMLQLGPVLERLHDELLRPVIDRFFGILLRRGALPPPPQELQGQELKVDFISVAAQAQKLLGTAGIERLASFVGNLAAARPDVLDKFNADEAVDEYANLLGTKPDLVMSDDEVAQIRQSRAQAAQAAQSQEAMSTVTQGAKTLSETDTSGDNALTRLVGNLGGVAPTVGQA